MKKLISMLLAMVMILSLAACGSTEAAPTEAAKAEPAVEATEAAKTEAPAEEPKGETMVEGGHFTMAIEEPINTLSWFNNYFSDQAQQVMHAWHDPMWKMNLDGTKKYYVAESCTLSEDALTYTIKLRNDVYWHDGEQLTADDFIYTLSWIESPECGIQQTTSDFSIDGKFCVYEKIDDLTFSVSISRPSNKFGDYLGYLIPYPEHIFKDVPMAEVHTCEQNQLDIGYGPFKIETFSPGEKIVLTRNENYYGEKAHIDTLEFRMIPNAGTQEIAFRNGELSVFGISNAETLSKYEAEGIYDINLYGDARICYANINPYAEATDTIEERQALVYALNLAEIVAGTYGNEKLCVVANSIFAPETMFYNPEWVNYEQDVEKAKELIAQTGLADKTIKVIYNNLRVGQEEMSIMIQSQLQAVGLNVEVEGMDSSGYLNTFFTTTDTFNIALMANGQDGDPGNFSGMFDNTRSGRNMYSSDEVNRLWMEIDKEADPAKRQELCNQVIAELKDCWSIVPYAQTNYVFASQTNIRGYEDTDRMCDFTKLYFVE